MSKMNDESGHSHDWPGVPLGPLFLKFGLSLTSDEHEALAHEHLHGTTAPRP